MHFKPIFSGMSDVLSSLREYSVHVRSGNCQDIRRESQVQAVSPEVPLETSRADICISVSPSVKWVANL